MRQYLKGYISLVLIGGLLGASVQPVRAQELLLPKLGIMVQLSSAHNPPMLKGIKVHPADPFKFEFVLDQGDIDTPTRGHVPYFRDVSSSTMPSEVVMNVKATQRQKADALKTEASKLIKYFLAALTVPEKDLWVNLSPYEKDRIVPDAFGQTEMGRDLLAQDYLLKQITASLMYPEGEVGKKFWKKIYEESAKRFGNTNVPVNTFNKVWIVPEKAVVYENIKNGTAYVVESRLKVMLEEDYLATKRAGDAKAEPFSARSASEDGGGAAAAGPAHVATKKGNTADSTQSIIREIIIPELIKEINQGQNFAQLRQVYNSLILATWYKKKIKQSILNQVYSDKNKIKGTEYNTSITTPLPTRGHVQARTTRNVSPSTLPNELGLTTKAPQGNNLNDVEAIYRNYLESFKKGAYNFIKEEQDPVTKAMIPRKYFSGGMGFAGNMAMITISNRQDAMKIIGTTVASLLLLSISILPASAEVKPSAFQAMPEIKAFPDDSSRRNFAGQGQLPNTRDVMQQLTFMALTGGGDITVEFRPRKDVASNFIVPQLRNNQEKRYHHFILPEDLNINELYSLMEKLKELPVGRDTKLASMFEGEISPLPSLKTFVAQQIDEGSLMGAQAGAVAVDLAKKARQELNALLYFRGVQMFAQGLKDIDVDSLAKGLAYKKRTGNAEAVAIEEQRIIKLIVSRLLQFKGWQSHLGLESSPNWALETNEFSCVFRSAVAAYYLEKIGIKVASVSVHQWAPQLKNIGHNLLVAALSNGSNYWVEPSYSIKNTREAMLSRQAFNTKGVVTLQDQNYRLVSISDWKKGLLASFLNNLGNAVGSSESSYKEELLQSSIELNTFEDWPHLNLGALYFDKGKYQKAIEYFKRAIKINPKRASSWNYMGAAHIFTGDLDIAEDELERSIGLDKNAFWPNYNLGLIHLRQLNIEGGLRLVDKAIQLGLSGIDIQKDLMPVREKVSGADLKLLDDFIEFVRKKKLDKAMINEATPTQLGKSFKINNTNDQVMSSTRADGKATGSDLGGIDLSSDKFLQLNNDGQGAIQFKIDPVMLKQLQDAPGLIPQIIDVNSTPDLRSFLGIADNPLK